ncbi:hypothetical protein MINTMi198_39260 [Mycobacterium intracellulare M.i.198]|uniref:Uncharacterized protein n=2 Tax=Mycobacteriaceae TaxID=1762 RepID=A0ABM7K361_9MYCO|nr:hypothetical protein MPRI_05540 [Mycobacterium paraintracellulare]BCO58737.1 hypothetical protein MINTM005_39810 [Mycobacterium intracellulare]BCP38556.1 hypothetical protein MINTMi198_39260 [Mycobacterium intracellulare M.i.198]BCO42959.1 hypothetical protein MINTM001_40980 [Mycobacterium paraintracellulare]BCO85406.1 hypothetical protein MINTM011_37410 [Mycobacterium paraintracellulare]
MDPVRRVLGRKVSIGGLIELAVWLAIPYLCIGFAWTVFHPEQTQRIHARIEVVSPAAADAFAFGVATVLWPAALQIADACPAP